MALPGLFFLLQTGSPLSSPDWLTSFLTTALYWVLAPGAVFGGIGAGAMTLWVQPGQTFRAITLGVVVGLGAPAGFFAALAIFLPKNEATMGWVLFGMVFAMTGAFAGVMAANLLKSE